jgi:phage baseplate assembly protein W
MAIYKGHSTYNRVRKFRLTDFELARQDLFNYFNIRKGEKLMNPNFGTIIWDLLYEPFNLSIKDAISEDIKRIVSYDPRLLVNNIDIFEKDLSLLIELTITYVPNNQTARMRVNFDRNSSS